MHNVPGGKRVGAGLGEGGPERAAIGRLFACRGGHWVRITRHDVEERPCDAA